MFLSEGATVKQLLVPMSFLFLSEGATVKHLLAGQTRTDEVTTQRLGFVEHVL